MTIDEYITSLRSQNIIVSVHNASIKVKAPDGVISTEVIKELTAKKQEILSFFDSIKLTKEFIKSSVDNDQLHDITYEEGQYDVIEFQKWRYLEHSSGVYNHMTTLMYEKLSNINEEVIFKTVDTLVSRHDSLRTLFLDKEGVVLQQVYPANKFTSNVSLVDISLTAQDKKEEKIRKMIYELENYIFDFQKERAFKCKLIKYEKNKYYFVFTIDHIIYDARSIEIIKEELYTLFDCYSKGIPNPLKPLKLQFKDYVNFINQHYKGSKLAYHQLYFKNLLKNNPPRLKLIPEKITNKLELSDQNFSTLNASGPENTGGGTFVFTISKEILDQILSFTLEFNVSLFNFLLANYYIFLSKISDQNDFVIDSPTSTRNNEDFSKVLGCLTGSLISRIKVEKNLTFKELLFKCRNVVIEAMDHIYYQAYPCFLKIKWDRLVSSQFNLLNDFSSAEGQILDFKTYHHDNEYVPLDISFISTVYENGIKVQCTYNREKINKSQISDVCNEYVNVVKSAINSPDIKIKNWDSTH